MWLIVIGCGIVIPFTLIVGFIGGFMVLKTHLKYKKEDEEHTPIELLKNALLTLAITTVKKDDVGPLGTDNYDEYTGDTYPPLSGCSVQNACFSYIFNQKRFKRSPLYSPHYSSKMDAIQKYLHKNVHTDSQVWDIFDKFFDKYVEKTFRDECKEEKVPKTDEPIHLEDGFAQKDGDSGEIEPKVILNINKQLILSSYPKSYTHIVNDEEYDMLVKYLNKTHPPGET